MSSKAIIVVSAQISRNHYEISAHHGTEDGQRRANATMSDLTSRSKWVAWQQISPSPIVSK